MKTIKNLLFLAVLLTAFSSCSSSDDPVVEELNLDLLINQWHTSSKTVNGATYNLETNCEMMDWEFKNAGVLTVDWYESGTAACKKMNIPVDWQYTLNDDIVEIAIAGYVHFKYKILAVTATTLKMQKIFPLENDNDVIIDNYTKI